MRGVALTVRPIEGRAAFLGQVLPLRHRVLWPEGPLATALVPGDLEAFQGDPITDPGSPQGANQDADQGAVAQATSGVATGADPVHLGIFEGFDDCLAGVLSLYLQPAEPPAEPSAEPSGGSARVQLRKFAVESWAQGRGLGSLLLAQAKAHAANLAPHTAPSVVLW